jgi:hypothetical protein
MLAQFEKGIALASIKFLKIKNVLVKSDGLLHIIDFDGDMIASVNFHAHTRMPRPRRKTGARASIAPLWFRGLPAQPDSDRHEGQPQSTRGRRVGLK